MPCWSKPERRLALWLAPLLALVGCSSDSGPGALSLKGARPGLSDSGPIIELSLDYQIGPALLEALHAGVPIRYAWTVQWRGEEAFWGATTLAERHGQLQVDYRSFTRWYTLSGTAAGTRVALPDIAQTEAAMARVQLPLGDAEPPVGARQLRVRIALDVGALPPTLRLPAYLSAEWHQDSGWFTLPLAAGPAGPDPAYY